MAQIIQKPQKQNRFGLNEIMMLGRFMNKMNPGVGAGAASQQMATQNIPGLQGLVQGDMIQGQIGRNIDPRLMRR